MQKHDDNVEHIKDILQMELSHFPLFSVESDIEMTDKGDVESQYPPSEQKYYQISTLTSAYALHYNSTINSLYYKNT
jgi:hypothetical protein